MSNITPTYNGAIPAFPQALSVQIEFTDIPYLIDLSANLMQGKINGVQTVYIDALNCDTDIHLVMLDTKQRITAKAKTQGYYPVLASQLMKFETSSDAPATYNIIFINFPIAAGTWGNTSTSSGSDYKLPIASEEILGGVKIGDGLEIDEQGYLSAIPSGDGGGGGSVDFLNDIFHFRFNSDADLNIPLFDPAINDHLIDFSSAQFIQDVNQIRTDNFQYVAEKNILVSMNKVGYYEVSFSINTELVNEGLNFFQLKKINLSNGEIEYVESTSQAIIETLYPISAGESNYVTGMRTASFIFYHNDVDYGYGINIQGNTTIINSMNGAISFKPIALKINDIPS